MCPFPPSYVYEGPNNCVLDRIYQNSLGGGGFTNIGGICVVDGNFFGKRADSICRYFKDQTGLK